MDRDSNTGDSFGRIPFTSSYGRYSVITTKQPVPRTHLTYDEGFQGRKAGVNDAYPAARYDHIHGGCNDCSTPTQIERAVIDQPLDHAEAREPGLPTHDSTFEWDDTTDHQQACHRLLDERDPDVASPPVGVQRSQIRGPFWLPFFQRRTTSVLFLVWFSLMAATLEALFAISQRNSGLSPGVPSVRYFWSYGATGILTLTAALWHRFDYEAKVLAPWIRADPITTSKAALPLDYIDVWSLLIPLRAFRNKDYQVIYSSTVSLLLQALIVLSTALFTLGPIKLIDNSEPIFLTGRFVDDAARLKDTESLLPYYITMGNDVELGNLSEMTGDNLTHPEGCTKQFAYQTFHPVSSNVEEVEATVDGLALLLACETASVGKRVPTPQFVFKEDGYVTYQGHSPFFEVDYQGCKTTIDFDLFTIPGKDDVWLGNKTVREYVMELRAVPGFTHQQCNSTDPAAGRVVFLSAELEWRSSNRSTSYDGYETVGVDVDATVSQSIALVCKPSLEQILLDVSRDSRGVKSVSRHDGSPADMFERIHPSDFIDFLFDEGVLRIMSHVEVGNSTVCADIHSQAVLGLCGQSCVGAPGLLNDAAFLQDILATFSADYAATTAHTMLTERVNITSTGTSSSILLRLWVQPIVCQAMFALLALLILINVGFQLTHQKKLTRSVNPGSIVSTMILAGKAASFTFPKDLGPASIEELRRALQVYLDKHGYSAPCPLQQPAPMDGVNPKGTGRDAYPVSSRTLAFRLPLPLQPVSQTALMFITPAIDMPWPGGDCSPILYIWGSHDTSPSRVTNISAVGCNNIVEVVDVTFALVGPDLSLDLSDAPAIDESTVRDIHGHGVLDSFDSYDLYEGLASLPITNHTLFDPFFQQLVTSRYAIPVSAIGDPTQADIVMDAIRRQHGIITAQFLNSNYRIDINSSTLMENTSAVLNPTLYNQSTSDGSARYLASVTYPFGRHRVVQDPTATVILETLLLVILILLAMGWYLGSREPLLPRSPTSVGSILALLAGGNVLEHLYDGGPEPLSWDDVKRRLGEDSKFYLGWDPSSTNEEFEQRRFGIWIIKRRE